jgi:hypothetical protein
VPFAVRNAQGHITSLHRHDPGVGQTVDANDPEVLAFLGLASAHPANAPGPDGDSGFGQLDADFIRVLEDVIDALTSRNVINITDLPEVAQSKLFARKSFRERRPSSALDLFHTTGSDHFV